MAFHIHPYLGDSIFVLGAGVAKAPAAWELLEKDGAVPKGRPRSPPTYSLFDWGRKCFWF